MEVFGVSEARRVHARFEDWAAQEDPGVASMHTTDLSLSSQINGNTSVHPAVDVMYDATEMPGQSGVAPENDPVLQDLQEIVKGEHNGWMMGATGHDEPRTVRFGFARDYEALGAEKTLKEALQPYRTGRVHLSKIIDEDRTATRTNPSDKMVSGESNTATVSVRSNQLGLGVSESEVTSMIEENASAYGGAAVGRENPTRSSVKRHYARFNSADAARGFARDLNKSLESKGLSSIASAEPGLPGGEVAARPNPPEKMAVVRLSMNTDDTDGEAPDLLTLAEQATDGTDAEISGARQSESAGQRDYMVSAPTTSGARSVINQFNTKTSTLGIANATSATLEHKAQRENPEGGKPAVVRVSVQEGDLSEGDPDPLSMVEEAAEANGGEVSGVNQGGGTVDYEISAPTTAKARSIINAANNKASTLGIAGQVSVSLQHEARKNPARKNGPHCHNAAENVYPSGTTPSQMREKIKGTAQGMGGQISEHSGSGMMVSFGTAEDAISLQEAVIDDANDMGVSNVIAVREGESGRDNPGGAGVMVRYPASGGLDQTVQQAAEEAGGTVRRINETTGPAYDGMKMADVRFNSETEAFEGQGEIESAMRSEGIGEFETRTSLESPPAPVRPNPLFPSGGQSEVAVQTEEPEGAGESLLTMDSMEEASVTEEARRLGREAGMRHGLPDYTDEEEAFKHAAETLGSSSLFENVDTSSPQGVEKLEEAASAWTNAYSEATGANWPRINPDLDPNARTNPEEPGPSEEEQSSAMSYLGLTALALGGGVLLGDLVLEDRERKAGATASTN
jgi:hypothetical protein